MNIGTFTKEPSSTVNFPIDWVPWLGIRTITASSWSVLPVTGITIVDEDSSATTTTIQLAGGTWTETYVATNRIVASDSEEEERTITIKIQQEQKYCTTLEVRRRMSGGSGAGGSATIIALPEVELDALIEQASRFLDLACGVPAGHFNPPAYPFATALTIYGDGINYLRLPPYVAGSLNTSITLPEGYTAPTFTEQDGFLVLNSSGVLPPFNHWNSAWGGWQSGVPVTASAIWGYQDVDAAIKMATIELVINLHRETDPASLKLTNLEGQPLRERLPPRVLEIARKYRFKVGPVFV